MWAAKHVTIVGCVRMGDQASNTQLLQQQGQPSLPAGSLPPPRTARPPTPRRSRGEGAGPQPAAAPAPPTASAMAGSRRWPLQPTCWGGAGAAP